MKSINQAIEEFEEKWNLSKDKRQKGLNIEGVKLYMSFDKQKSEAYPIVRYTYEQASQLINNLCKISKSLGWKPNKKKFLHSNLSDIQWIDFGEKISFVNFSGVRVDTENKHMVVIAWNILNHQLYETFKIEKYLELIAQEGTRWFTHTCWDASAISENFMHKFIGLMNKSEYEIHTNDFNQRWSALRFCNLQYFFKNWKVVHYISKGSNWHSIDHFYEILKLKKLINISHSVTIDVY